MISTQGIVKEIGRRVSVEIFPVRSRPRNLPPFQIVRSLDMAGSKYLPALKKSKNKAKKKEREKEKQERKKLKRKQRQN